MKLGIIDMLLIVMEIILLVLLCQAWFIGGAILTAIVLPVTIISYLEGDKKR